MLFKLFIKCKQSKQNKENSFEPRKRENDEHLHSSYGCQTYRRLCNLGASNSF